MIDMTVREQDFFNPRSRFRYCLFDGIDVSAGIDDGADIGFFIPNDRTILLKRSDWHDQDLRF